MPDNTKTLPEQIIETSKAFTKSLEMENHVFQTQLNGSVDMTVTALQSLIALCKDATTISNLAQARQNIADTVKQALADVQQTTASATPSPSAPAPSPENTITDAVLDTAVLHPLTLSYQNAVNAQQQAFILQQAAATQVISTLISVVTAALAVAVKDAEG